MLIWFRPLLYKDREEWRESKLHAFEDDQGILRFVTTINLSHGTVREKEESGWLQSTLDFHKATSNGLRSALGLDDNSAVRIPSREYNPR